jgi:outer membrane protein TolC
MQIRITLIGLMAASAAAAQQPSFAERGPLELSLKQAVEIALAPEGSARLQLAEQAVKQAEARSGQARAALLPGVDSYAAWQNQTRNLAAFGIRIETPIPGFRIPERVGPFTTFDARLSATQTIFDFSSIRRFQASRAGIRAAREDAGSAREQIMARVAGQYMAALAAQAHVEAANANVELADAVLKLARNRKNAGTGLAIEVTRAEVQRSNERQRLLVAENQLRQAKLELLRAMGVSLDREAVLKDRLAYAPADKIAVDEAVKKALENRQDLKAQQRREENARLSYGAVKFERLPSLAGFADYGSIGTAVDSAVPTRTYGLQLRLPLFDGGRRDARRGESAAQLREARIRTADLREQIEFEVRVALDSLRSAEEQVQVAQEGLAQAERETEQARRRYEAGVANSLEPTDAQTRMERARDNLIAALLNFNLARISLGQATGTVQEVIQ